MVVIGLVVLIRLSLLLPAIAVDAPGASVANSVADTKGHAWMIVKPYLTIVVVFVLIVMAAAALAGLTGMRGASGSFAKGSLASSVFIGVVAFVALCAGTIVAARLFMSLGERLKGRRRCARVRRDGASYDRFASSRNACTASKSLRRLRSMMMLWVPSARPTERLPGEFTSSGNSVCAI